MMVFGYTGNGIVQAHAEEGGCFTAKRFPIKKVAPAADKLTNQESEGCNIQNCENANLFHTGIDENADCSSDNGTVNCNSSVPDIEDGNRIACILLPLKSTVVCSCAENCKRGNG